MKIKLRVIEFKTVSPLFEMERDGIKPFTTRLVDYHDPRFRALAQWRPAYFWLIKVTNPATGEYFFRRLIDWVYIKEPASGMQIKPPWMILYLGEEIKEE